MSAMEFKVACIQNIAGADMMSTLERAQTLSRHALDDGADFVCLPEYFSCLDLRGDIFEVGPHHESEHPAIDLFSQIAADSEAWVLLGSLAVRGPSEKIFNRSILIDASGKVARRYDKIHLFDVDLADGESYRESDIIEPGGEAVLADLPWSKLGMTICYDLRFPALFRTLAQAGAEVLTVPAAFTRTTGEAHWHSLLRARAIENGAYVIAPCQTGTHGEAESFGHSLIVDPWGEIVADGGFDEGVVMAMIEPAKVAEARAMIPALMHDRPFAVKEDVGALAGAAE